MNADSSRGDLIRRTACEVVELLARGEVAARELVEACRLRIEEVDGALNALPTLCVDRARERASEISAHARSGEDAAGWLGGLPVAVKDLNPVAGVRTTFGSAIFADHVPDESDYTVERLESNGAVIVAKSNTPEFGAGGTTFNDVFGITSNPWNTGRTCGGSSGGSCVAVATGQAWAASGSDFGGSLRIPASFCGVVGLRPTPGVVPRGPATQPFSSLWVDGPIARNVADCALMLDAMSGRDVRDPLSRTRPVTSYLAKVRQEPVARPRVACSSDLGVTPVDPVVARAFSEAIDAIAATGARIEEDCPDMTGAPAIFHTLRASWLAADMGALLDGHESEMKPELVWNIRKGMTLSADEIGRAEVERGRLYRRFVEFFDRYDFLLTPATVVAPFDKDERFPETIDGRRLETYLDWYAITYCVSLTACPAMSLPIGFTDDGLPVGMQIVGPPFSEVRLLTWAAQLESMLGISGRLPIDPIAG